MTSTAFSLNSLLNPPAQQSAYSAQNFFVTNSGLYDYTICEARYATRMIKGMQRQTIEMRGVATHKLHPEHTGRLIIKIDVPNPNEPHASDYIYHSLCVATNVVTSQQQPDGSIMLYPDLGEQVLEDKFNGGTFTQLNRLQNQHIIVSMARREFNGRNYLNPTAVFDVNGFSGYEIASGLPRTEGAQPKDIKNVSLAFEGLPLEAVQRGGSTAQADSGFNAAPQAPQHPTAPSAQAANPYAQMGQSGNPQAPAPNNNNDIIPF